MAPRILGLGIRWRRMVSSMPRRLYPQGKSPRYSYKRLGGAGSRSGHGVKEKNFQPPPGIEPRSSARQTCIIQSVDWWMYKKICLNYSDQDRSLALKFQNCLFIRGPFAKFVDWR